MNFKMLVSSFCDQNEFYGVVPFLNDVFTSVGTTRGQGIIRLVVLFVLYLLILLLLPHFSDIPIFLTILN